MLGLFFVLFLLPNLSFATHLRAGEISYRHVSGKRYEITVTMYAVSPLNVPVITNTDDPVITIGWGDGTSEDVARTTVDDKPQGIKGLLVRINTYKAYHTFPGPGQFFISVSQSDRNGGVVNIPNSITTDFFIESELIINPFLGGNGGLINHTPILLNPPLDEACLNRRYIHNPVAFDPDGDSLTYRIIACRQENGAPIPGYRFPDQVQPGQANTFTIDPHTGDLVWDAPKQVGEYNIAFIIEEFRQGVKVGSVVRDMQINVYACSNQPPIIANLIDTCIVAGESVTIPITASDPNTNDIVSLSAIGQPFLISPGRATLLINKTGNPSLAQIDWNTQCNAVMKSKYQISVKAQDNSTEVVLSDIKNAYVQVNGPPPVLDTAIPQGNSVLVTWEPYICNNAIRFDLYRSNGSLGYNPGYCETGIPSSLGYTLVHSTSSIQDTFYIDNSLSFSAEFCYRLVAVFPDGAESVASNEICAIARRDIPVLTQVTVDNTDIAVGSDTVVWALPIDLDTIVQYPGPYEYRVYRESGINQANNLIYTTPSSNSLALTDTVFRDLNINTEDTGYTYRVELYSNGIQVGTSSNGSSVFLTTAPSDRLIQLKLNAQVPWTNQFSEVYRLNDVTGLYDFVGSTTTTIFNDSNLTNGTEYCYYVKTSGAYFNPTVRKPLINYSQITCETPIDKTPPCLPAIEFEASCEDNRLNMVWADTNIFCTADLEFYNLYYSPTTDGKMNLLKQLDENTFNFSLFDAPNLVGCYALTVTDTIGNESGLSKKYCVDNCAEYELPNVFTPNNDGVNDFFQPFPYKGIESIAVKVYNRWGVLLFETTDPNILWDGQVEGKPVADGVYFYTVDINTYTLEGLVTIAKNGNVTVLRNGSKLINTEGN